jgi:5-methyltetrahydropteroyltriglutamate--homocysteine methyltransferase
MTAMKNIQTHVLGFPRIGARRELKFALESYWAGNSNAGDLLGTAAALRARHWRQQADAGLDWVTVGDFALYDQVANHLQWFGCEPARFGFDAATPRLERGFAMARGIRDGAAGQGTSGAHGCCAAPASDGAALDMTKWFDTNYHYLVPEFLPDTTFTLDAAPLLDEVADARALGHAVKAVLIGPLTLLWLGKEKAAGFDRLDLLDRLLPAYGELLGKLAAAGVEWVQLDEPILGLDLPPAWRNVFESSYWQLNQAGARLMLATYFSPLEENLSLACRLPIAGLHVDGVRAPHELVSVSDWLPSHKVLSVGIIDGRNVWKTNLDSALATVRPLLEKRGQLWLAPSCSLLHVPVSLADETELDPEILNWLAFGAEKLGELGKLKRALNHDADDQALAANRAAIASRAASGRVHRDAVAARLQGSDASSDQRSAPFARRQLAQQQRFDLPAFPTTTIGSFPQTAAIRSARASWRSGKLGLADYEQAMRTEIADAVARQEALGLDVLVHGEAERNDMVEYFGEQLDGFAFTRYGWVQSYGSRCVKPPIIFGDVARPAPMTVDWTVHAQSLTTRPMKGMLTGPVTILQWSFVRDDQPRQRTALQIALALRDEVRDLEQAGIGIIQIDEPALREGLPLRRSRWADYLDWSTRAFRVACAVAGEATQIHTHMCYAEFNDILPQIAALDADVITIETSRSAMALLDGFGSFRYPNQIGPGVYDIHSPAVPSTAAMLALLQRAAKVIPPAQLWVNPDCGLKTRGWAETEAALANMVEAARTMRKETIEN